MAAQAESTATGSGHVRAGDDLASDLEQYARRVDPLGEVRVTARVAPVERVRERDAAHACEQEFPQLRVPRMADELRAPHVVEQAAPSASLARAASSSMRSRRTRGLSMWSDSGWNSPAERT